MTTKIKNIVVTCVMAALLLGMSAFCWFKPADAFSNSERRTLKQFPKFVQDQDTGKLSFAPLFNGTFMTNFEDYTLDQFPLRDSFRTLKSFCTFYIFRQLDNNDIYVKNGYAAKLEYPMNTGSLDHAADRFRNIYDSYLAGKNMNIYFSIIPDKSYFLAEDNGYLALDYAEFITYLRDRTDFMEYIDITGDLALDSYYKTDTHWRQEKLLDVATTLAKAMGTSVTRDYTTNTLDHPFYGVYYGQSALPLPAETIYYLTSDSMNDWIITNYDTLSGKPETMSVYDMKKGTDKDPYELFLSGSLSLLTIENPNATTDKELIIFRDSFGSSLTPLLADGYAKVTLIDIRYIPSAMLGRLVDFKENQDVLFIYSTLVLNSSDLLT